MSALHSASYWLHRVLRVLVERHVWWRVRHVPGGTSTPRSLPTGYRLLRENELQLGYPGNEARNRRIEERLADPRQHGLGVAWGDGMVYDTWIWSGSYSEPNSGLILDPGPRGGVLLDSWTAPTHRGRGLHGVMLDQRLSEATRLGLVPMDGLVHLRNVPALKAQQAAGAQALARIVVWRVLRWRWTRTYKAEWHELDLD
jgi:hypothetical protein